MSILLVGCGYWGQNWAKTLYRLGELAAVCDPRPSIHQMVQENYPGTALYEDVAQALKDPNVEAVVVATPVFTHLEVGQACLEAGKAVLVEKPLTVNTADAQKLVNLARQKGLVLAVGHILMHHPALMALRDLIQSGELGEVRSVQCTRVNLGKVRNEENVWWSLAPHDLSILSLLLAESFEPLRTVQMPLLGRASLPDTVMAQFVTPTGRFGAIHVSWLHPVKKHETLVIGTKKMAIFEDTQPAGQKLALVDYTLDPAEGKSPTGEIQSVQKGETTYISYPMADELLALEAKAFIEAFRNGTPLPNDGENGLHVVRMLETVQHMMEHPDKTAAPRVASAV